MRADAFIERVVHGTFNATAARRQRRLRAAASARKLIQRNAGAGP
jgi:hypothetical protein